MRCQRSNDGTISYFTKKFWRSKRQYTWYYYLKRFVDLQIRLNRFKSLLAQKTKCLIPHNKKSQNRIRQRKNKLHGTDYDHNLSKKQRSNAN